MPSKNIMNKSLVEQIKVWGRALATKVNDNHWLRWLLGLLAFTVLFWLMLPKYLWSLDGAHYVLNFQAHEYTGVTGHPVYAYLGWLLDLIIAKCWGGSMMLVANVYTYLSSLALVIMVLVVNKRWVELGGWRNNQAMTLWLLIASPYFLYFVAQVEVYVLASVWALVVIYALLRAKGDKAYGWLALAASAWALGLGTHLNLVFLAPLVLALLAKQGYIRQWRVWILMTAVGASSLLAIYWPAYDQFRDLGQLWSWATASGAKGHFFGASWAVLIKKLCLIGLMIVPGLLAWVAAYKRWTRRDGYLWWAYALTIVTMIISYASSPVNAEIEQILLAVVLLGMPAALWFDDLSGAWREVIVVSLIMMSLSVIPIKLGFNLKDEMVERALVAIDGRVPTGANVWSPSLNGQLAVFRPELNVWEFSYQLQDNGQPTYLLDGSDWLPVLTRAGYEYEVLESWPRPKVAFEKILFFFIDPPASWRKEYVLAKINGLK
jgi:hypothetical protein